jgi:hypothetical protein
MYKQKIIEKNFKTNIELENKQKNFFKPRLLNKKTIEILSTNRPEFLEENFEQKVDRLANFEAKFIEEKKKKLEKEYYEKFNFKPKIDNLSKVLGF